MSKKFVLGLETVLSSKLNITLSSGEKQLIYIIRALILKPQVLILDEPELSLDSEIKNIIYKLLINYSKEAIVIVLTHDDFLLKMTDNIYSFENENIQKKIETNIMNTNYQINEIYQNDKMFHFIVEENDLINKKKYNNDIYFYKNNLNVEIFEENKLLYHYIFSEGKFYRIIKNKKKLIKNQNIINNSFFSFWWNFLNLADIAKIIETNNTYICETEQEDLLIKLLLDKNFNIIQLEVISNEDIVRYKITNNLKLEQTDIYFPEYMYIYIDSIALKENKILVGEIIALDKARFDLSKYKKLRFVEHFIDFFNYSYQ